MKGPWNVAVLMGGTSAERDISLDSGNAVAEALRSRGHRVVPVDFCHPLEDIRKPEVAKADVVFVALHGGCGEDGRVQALLELAGLPYVGSGPGASAVAMDKVWSKRLALQMGVATPSWRECEGSVSPEDLAALADALGYPLVRKPVDEGSSLGVVVASSPAELMEGWEDFAAPGRWMLESFIAGREITVPVLGGEPLPVLEIRPLQGFYDFLNKYTKGRCEYDCPARLPAEIAEAATFQAKRLHDGMRLRDLARVDFRLDEAGELWFLEANTIPGMTDLSLLPMGADLVGIDFAELCHRLCAMALERGASPGGRC